MSKDKGEKNQKKAPADKSTSKNKEQSSYKNENQGGPKKSDRIDEIVPKPKPKTNK